MQVGTQVAEVTKPLASVDEMVSSGMMVIMHRSGGIAKRLDADSERRILGGQILGKLFVMGPYRLHSPRFK